MATTAELKKRSVLDVASALGMEMKPQSGNTYYWTEHDSFKINTSRNIWHWFSQDKGGDVIRLVQEMKQVSFKEAKHFLETGAFPEVVIQEEKQESFRYILSAYEQPDFALGRQYLKEERGLSDETIDTFLKAGNLAEATRKKGDYFEPVIVFKYRDTDRKVIGASLQGIVENRVQYPERGRLKQIMRNSDGLAGFSLDIGQPKRLVFAESPIDLMSYYQVHQETLNNVRLVSMDGLKKGVISRYTADLLTDGRFSQEMSQEAIRSALDNLRSTTTELKKHPGLITLAIDNDEAGNDFIENLQKDNIPFQMDLPPREKIQEKMDWNDYLKQKKGETMVKQKTVEELHAEWESMIKNQLRDKLGHKPQWWEFERGMKDFVVTESDRLFAKRTSLQLNLSFADGDKTDIYRDIERLDKQILAAYYGKNEAKSSPKETRTVSEMIADKDTKALAKHMKEGVKAYFNSDQYKTFLTAMGKFPNYSARNIQLLMAQNPDATLVTSFKKWKTDFNRSINKGAKSLRIWAPTTVTKKDKQTGEPVLDGNGNPVHYTRFILVPVFDISQTNGEELPKMIYDLEGTHQDYANLYRAARTVSNENHVPLEITQNMEGTARGYYQRTENKIVIRGGMSEQQTLKTIFHEMAHSDLHNSQALSQQEGVTRSNEELQAESVAYVVASHYGLDTSEYSFGYLASWSRDPKGLADLEAQLSIVQQEAKSLIGRLDTVLEKQQQLSQSVTQTKFTERLNHFKEEAQRQQKERAQEEPRKKAPALQEQKSH